MIARPSRYNLQLLHFLVNALSFYSTVQRGKERLGERDCIGIPLNDFTSRTRIRAKRFRARTNGGY